MKKKAVLRGLLGFPLGLAISYVFSIVASLIWAKGHYSPCAPALVDMAGSEIGAVILQALLSGILGAGFAAASVIWEREDWSIAKQTGVCFAIYAVIMLPIAYVTNWMAHTWLGFLSYVGIFALIFVVIWLIMRLIWKSKIAKLNAQMPKL